MLWIVVLIVLVVLAVGGGHFGGPTPGTGYYPANYGYGTGGLLLLILVLFLIFGRGGL
jgi:hypothetical protein